MNLSKLTLKLELMREKYFKKYGFEPQIWEIEEDEEDDHFIRVHLCKKVTTWTDKTGRVAVEPYLVKRIRIRKELRNDW